MSDFTYVENVAHAHICAEKALRSRGSNICGKVQIWSSLYSVLPFDGGSFIYRQCDAMYCRPFSSLISSQWNSRILYLLWWRDWDIKGKIADKLFLYVYLCWWLSQTHEICWMIFPNMCRLGEFSCPEYCGCHSLQNSISHHDWHPSLNKFIKC